MRQYTGTAYYLIAPNALGALITGGLNGGVPAEPVPDHILVENTTVSIDPPTGNPGTTTTIGSSGGNQGANVGQMRETEEPINLVTGDYFNTTTDLRIGSQGAPYGLAFDRYYDSGTRLRSGPLGFGWTHGFALSTRRDSDPFAGLGVGSPISGAAAIAALVVAVDLINTGVTLGAPPLDRMYSGTIAMSWLMGQLTNNVVAVTQPGYVEHFIKLADGSYNPPPGSAARLTVEGGGFKYVTGDKTTLVFNSDGNLSSWLGAAGVSMTFLYGGTVPVLTSVSNNLGRSLALTYHPSGLLTQVTDDSGRSVTYTYDGAGNLSTFTDPLGQVTTYAYDLPGRLTNIFYPWSPVVPLVTNTYDSLGRVRTQTNVNGATWEYFFAGARSEEVDPYGVRHVLYPTSRGKTRIEVQDWQGPQQAVSTNVHDALDRVTLAMAPEGNSAAYTYDSNSNVLTLTRTPKSGSPLSPLVTTTVYDPTFNKPTRVTDPRGLSAVMEYQPWTGNLTAVIADSANLKARTSYTYNNVGQVLTVTDPVGTLTRYVYDSVGNLTSTVADAGPGRLNLTTSSTYNARGDPLTVTDARGNVTTSTYDLARRRLSITSSPTADAPAGLLTRYTYDPAGRIVQTQQSANGSILRTTSATWTRAGKPETTTDAAGNTTRFAYDPLDRLLATTDPMGRTTRYAYDTLGRRISASNPAIQPNPLARQSFTANGLRASLTDANGNTTAFAYDGLDRLSTTAFPGGSTEVLTYDADSNVLTRKTRAGSTPIAYTYDTLNRLLTKTPHSPWPAVSYSYDLSGRQTAVSDTSAAIASIDTPVSTTTYAAAYTYDALNRPRAASWDPVPAAASPAAGPLVTFNHSYNKANQRTGEAVTDNTWLGYPAATPANTAYAANTLNQYTAVGAVSPTYDANGNLTSDGTYTLGYDAENRLISASGGGNTAAYAFDAQGRRKARTVNGTTTISVTDADNREVLEYDGSTGAVLRWYAYGLGPNAVLNQINVGASTRDTLLPNLLGSIIASFDTAGALTKFGYQPYGSGPAAPQFAYTGQRIDLETGGLYYYRARHYSPAWGRFLQADPIRYDGGMVLYAYAGNDPLNLLDPLGLNAEGATSGREPRSPQGYADSAWAAATAGIGHNGGPPLIDSATNSLRARLLAGVSSLALIAIPSTPLNSPETEILGRLTAYSYYQSTGMSADRIASHMAGIDFTRPVSIGTIPQGSQVVQYQAPGRPMGSYFAPVGTPATALGIDSTSRVAATYVTTREVSVLVSTAANTAGNLNVPSQARGQGGGTQFFTRDISSFSPFR